MAPEIRRIDLVLEELKEIYNHPTRTYHNLSHIYGMLDRLEESRHFASFPHRIELAIWFHDAVYYAKASDNEIKSAELWTRKMALFLDDEPLEWGRRAILATIDHLPSDDPDIQLLLDLDLAPLGAPYEAFQAIANSLFEEYSRAGIYWHVFNEGRKKFLGKLIERPNIFGTEFWHSRLEKQTRENIRRRLSA